MPRGVVSNHNGLTEAGSEGQWVDVRATSPFLHSAGDCPVQDLFARQVHSGALQKILTMKGRSCPLQKVADRPGLA